MVLLERKLVYSRYQLVFILKKKLFPVLFNCSLATGNPDVRISLGRVK